MLIVIVERLIRLQGKLRLFLSGANSMGSGYAPFNSEERWEGYAESVAGTLLFVCHACTVAD